MEEIDLLLLILYIIQKQRSFNVYIIKEKNGLITVCTVLYNVREYYRGKLTNSKYMNLYRYLFSYLYFVNLLPLTKKAGMGQKKREKDPNQNNESSCGFLLFKNVEIKISGLFCCFCYYTMYITSIESNDTIDMYCCFDLFRQN